MNELNHNFCFCTLALGSRYRLMTKELAKDLSFYAPKIPLVVCTDLPSDFQDCENIIPFEFYQTGILHCYHDRRFVIQRGLSLFETAILIDADTKIINHIPESIEAIPGVIGAFSEPLIPHVQKYNPERLSRLQKIATKLALDLTQSQFVGESLIIISRSQNQAQEFINWWGKIGTYLELRGIHAGSGNIIGLAALKTGFTIQKTPNWEKLNQVRQHLDASYNRQPQSQWQQLQRRLMYHYRLNKTRLIALQDFNFYYR
jgi:hypothetical protein